MKLELTYPHGYLDGKFAQWLIQRIQEMFIYKLDVEKLKQWDVYFSQDEELNSDKRDVKTRRIVIHCIKNLTYRTSYDKMIITFNNRFVPGFNKIKIDTMCRLINYGNTSIRGYPIFIEVFQYVADNIDKYVRLYKGLI